MLRGPCQLEIISSSKHSAEKRNEACPQRYIFLRPPLFLRHCFITWRCWMALSTQAASSSLPSAGPAASGRKHDVFLSFRGEDTRESFLSHLYHELQNVKGIKTFRDDQQLEKGTAISLNLLTAIEESRFAIVVLSTNYASSAWCLDELTKITQCMEGKDTILPIFYHVDPSDVRHQRGNYEAAFTKHERSGQDLEKVKRWRVALEKVAKISGWDSKNHKTERELVEDIVKFVRNKVPTEIESPVAGGDFEAFEATNQAMEELMKALKNDEVTIIGVYGMGGVGKTTLVKHVGAQAQKKGLFDLVIMVSVSQSPDVRHIQAQLAEMLELKLTEETKMARACRLEEKLMKKKKILIILDDMWEKIDLPSIGILNQTELRKCKSKVLLTTRRRNVCHAMRTQAKITLNILSEEDSWRLFVKTARRSFHESTDFYDVARKVAKECAGLPIAVKAVAKALGDKDDLDEWKVAARRLEMSQPANLDDEEDVFKCIKLSYEYLKGDDAKSCFLLCCLFPEDADIEIAELMKYGFGKGLFRDLNTMQEARATAHSVVKYLKACSLLLNGTKEGCVRMHDVIRDTAMKIALSEDGHGFMVKAGHKLKDWPTEAHEAHEGYSAISLMQNEIRKLPQKLVCSKLQILLLQSNVAINQIPKSFFQIPNELRVLNLSSTSILLLPPSFSHLTNLQALYLDYCEKIMDISVLGKLKKLEILSMRSIPLKEFPKQIGELTNLRMLDVTNACVDTIPSKVISKLHRLEEVYVQCRFRDWGRKVEGGFFPFYFGNNAGFEELTGLSCLNVLTVTISDVECLPKSVSFLPNWINFNICISRPSSFECDFFNLGSHHVTFRYVTLDTTMNTLPGWFVNVVTEKAEILEYRRCSGLENILVEYDSGRLGGLKYLAVNGQHENLEVLMNSRRMVANKPVFESLEELHLEWVDCLRELCVGELPPGSLCNLKLLNVRYCPKLVNALLLSNLLHPLQNLEILICEGIRGLDSVFGFEGLEPEKIVLTKLREIKLRHLEKLTSIWSGPAPNGVFHNLKSLIVFKCKILKSLLTSDVAQCLLQLEHLWVAECYDLVSVIEPIKEAEINKVVIPNLKGICLKRLPQLTGFHISTTGTATIDHIECPSLEHLYVFNCPQFSTSASDFHSRNHVQVDDSRPFEFLFDRLWDRKIPSVPEFN